ncbi:nitroreductase family protein [Paenibacillus caui]|uniref:nitroreductase family protein n=1 Tax=Paenibacillus caui TaxID=2873927 RepID=UPI001CA848F9|nr:hypothetical protein [Paenibacillus caui]
MVKKIVLAGLAALIAIMLGIAVLIYQSPQRSEMPMNSKLPVSEDLKKIIYYGSLAPSSHNAQMWKVGIRTDSEIAILVDRDRLLPEVDPGMREAFLSIGAFIENIVQAADALGYDTKVTLMPGNTGNEVAGIVFSRSSGGSASRQSSAQIIDAINIRHTMKEPFLKQPLKPGDLNAFESIDPHQITYYPADSSLGRYITNGTTDSMAKQVQDDGKQQEMANWTRISTREAKSSRDGITPEMMGISGVRKLFFKAFLTHSSLISDSYRKQTVDSIRQQAESAAGFVVIGSEGDSRQDLIQTGRIYERLLLAGAGRRVAIHTMSSMLEESPWKDEVKGKLGLSGVPQFVLRVGYVKDYGKPTSLRRPIDEFAFMLNSGE